MTARKPMIVAAGQLKQLPSGDTLATPASVLGAASLSIPHGLAPSSPSDGDIWTTTAGLYCRINGVTVGPFTTGGGGGGGGGGSLLVNNNLGDVASPGTSRSNIGGGASGAVTGSGLTQATGKLLGRTTASSGAIEEISPGTGLSLASGLLSATGGVAPGGTALTPPTTSTLSTAIVPTGGTLTATDGTASFSMLTTAQAGVWARLRSLPGGDFAVIAKMSGFMLAQYATLGIIFRDTGNKFTGFGTAKNFNSADQAYLRSENWSTKDAYASDASYGAGLGGGGTYFLKGAFTASTNDIEWFFGPNGVDWLTLGTNTYLGTADAVGIGSLHGGSSAVGRMFCEHFAIV